jgi:hypothetical protein
MPRWEQRLAHKEEVNWAPRSDVRVAGTLNRVTHPMKRAVETVAADVEERGNASGQRVVRSTTVSR